jgi:hypothetical protein
MSVPGQTEKNSIRADVFRCSRESGHRSRYFESRPPHLDDAGVPPGLCESANGRHLFGLRRKRPPTEAALLRPEPGDEARAAPKFDRAIIEKRLGLFDGFAIIAANDSPEVFKMFVGSDEIGSVI